MTNLRRRRATLVASLSLLLAAIATGSTAAVADPAPRPPRDQVLAADPGTVIAPYAAVSTALCPTPKYGVQSSAPGTGRTVALTFDDGPGVSTMGILSILQRYGVPATFFNVGVNETIRPTLVRAEATIGIALGNHTWSHPSLIELSPAEQGTEMDKANSTQATLVGQPACTFRPPYGDYNTATLDAAFQRRMSVWTWSVDTEDWKANGSADQYWVDRIVSLAKEGGAQQHPVVLMHNQPAGNPATVAALPQIIEYYRSLGYTFVDLHGHAGYTRPGPASAVTTGGVQLFVRGDDGGLNRRTGTGGTWTGWTELGGAMFDGPSAVTLDATTAAVFIQGPDNHVYTQTLPDTGSPGGWTDLGGVVTSRPTAAIAPNGTLSVIARGTDGAAWIRERTGGAWGGWSPLGGVLTSALASAATGGNELTVAAVGADNAVWVRTRTSSWSAWRSVGGAVTAEPALSATAGGGGLALLARGSDNAYWLRLGNPGATSWGVWTTIGGVLICAPNVVVDGTRLDAFGYGTDGRLYQNVATGGSSATGWSGWQILPP